MSLTTPLVRLRILPALLPVDGLSADIRISPDGLYIQKQVGLGAWENLIAVANLRGSIGPKTELRSNGSYVQWRSEGGSDTSWRDLFQIPEGGGSGGGMPPPEYVELKANKGQPGGYASLDDDGKVPLVQVPLNPDAATLQGQSGAFYRNASNLNTGTVPSDRLPAASGSQRGATLLSSSTTSASNTSAATPAAVKAVADLLPGKADKATTLAGYGINDAYTKAQTDAAIAAGGSSGGSGDTASQILDKLKTVDGSGSGLDAGLLEGQLASYYLDLNDRGAAGGVAPLGNDSKIPLEFIPDLPASTAATVWRLSTYLNGATGDNRPDLLALADEVTAAGGGTIIVDRPIELSAAWRFTGTVSLTIRGEGPGKIKLYRSGSNPAPVAAIRFVQCSRVLVHDLYVYADAGPNEDIGFMLETNQCTHVTIKDSIAENMLTGPWFGYSQYVLADNVKVINPRRDGIHFALGCLDGAAVNCLVVGAQDDGFACTTDQPDQQTVGLPYRRTSRIKFIGNTAQDIPYGMGAVTYDSDNVVISNNIFRSVGNSGIAVSPHIAGQPNGQHIVITGNIIVNPGLHGPLSGDAYQYECGIFVANGSDVLVEGNNIRTVTAGPSGNKGGVVAQNCQRVTIKGNKVSNVSGFGVNLAGLCQDLTITDNEFDAITRSGISSVAMSAGFGGTFLDISGNYFRRVSSTDGFPLQIDASSAGNVMLARNRSAQAKTSSCVFPAGGFSVDNFPAIWIPYTPSFSSVSGSLSVSGVQGRYCFEGGACLVNGSCNITSNNGGGVTVTAIYPADDATVAFLTGWMGANNVPFIGRHRDNFPGSYAFVNAGSSGSTQVGPVGTGEFRFEGRIPIN